MPFVPGLVPPERATPRTWFLVHDGALIVREGGSDVDLPTDEDVASLALDESAIHYLGELDGSHAFAGALSGPPPAPFAARKLRWLYGALTDIVFDVAGRATHIVDWATTHRYCGRCATQAERMIDERAMRCPSCGLTSYPRIAPAIIVLVRRGDEALLARNARFPLPFYSTLAGFSEVGETLEETLVREVREEVGVTVNKPRYFGSQPWPFPHSLMIGFFAEYERGDIVVDEKEIAHADWFRADALPTIPPPLSIARRLIDAWVAEVRR